MRLAIAIRLGLISRILITLGLCSFQTIRAADSDDHPVKTVENPLRIERSPGPRRTAGRLAARGEPTLFADRGRGI